MNRKPNAVELAQQLIRTLQSDQAGNDAEPEVDEEAIDELVRKDVERARRARRR